MPFIKLTVSGSAPPAQPAQAPDVVPEAEVSSQSLTVADSAEDEPQETKVAPLVKKVK